MDIITQYIREHNKEWDGKDINDISRYADSFRSIAAEKTADFLYKNGIDIFYTESMEKTILLKTKDGIREITEHGNCDWLTDKTVFQAIGLDKPDTVKALLMLAAPPDREAYAD